MSGAPTCAVSRGIARRDARFCKCTLLHVGVFGLFWAAQEPPIAAVYRAHTRACKVQISAYRCISRGLQGVKKSEAFANSLTNAQSCDILISRYHTYNKGGGDE